MQVGISNQIILFFSPFCGILKETAVNIYGETKKYTVSLTDDELKEFKAITRRKETSKMLRCRCQILIDLDEAHGKVPTHQQSARSNGVCMATVTNIVKLYIDGGIDSVTSLKRNVNSDNARRKLDGRAESFFGLSAGCGMVCKCGEGGENAVSQQEGG